MLHLRRSHDGHGSWALIEQNSEGGWIVEGRFQRNRYHTEGVLSRRQAPILEINILPTTARVCTSMVNGGEWVSLAAE